VTSGAWTERLAGAFGAALSPAGPRARLAVFTYHQVLRQRDALRPDEPDVREFTADIDLIARVFTVLPLREAVQRLKSGTLPARAACITFDDGYENNHSVAAPVLTAAGVPASFFIACGAIDDGVMWNDLLIEAVARCRATPRFDGLTDIDTAPLVRLSGAALVRALLGAMKYQPLEQRLVGARRFFEINAGAAAPRLMMSRGQVADLARHGFDIGGHTVHHPILKTLPDADARREIEDCSRWIEAVTGRKPTTFAYPNGRPGRDFAPAHAAMVAAAGYETAVSTQWMLARRGCDPYSVPRLGPWWRQGHSLVGGLVRTQLRSYWSA
jgi:peptidoglycan/xylan/chitin deacetylase (PgdA/CDA1 family)